MPPSEHVTRNIRLTIAYDGTNYVGWQVQPNGRSVQAVVESAIRKLTGADARLLVAGRTDSGVHALGQVANFETMCLIPCDNIRSGLQNFLPDDVVIRDAADVAADFHSTYSAKRKRYRYVVHNTLVTNPFVRNYTYHYRQPLDTAAMHAAGQTLLGTHDFRCFESHFPNKATSVRTVMELTVARQPQTPIWLEMAGQSIPAAEDANSIGDFIWIDIVADGFLYNMVRAIARTLIHVGRGAWTANDVATIVANQNRSQAGDTAPPQGLYLVSVDYE